MRKKVSLDLTDNLHSNWMSLQREAVGKPFKKREKIFQDAMDEEVVEVSHEEFERLLFGEEVQRGAYTYKPPYSGIKVSKMDEEGIIYDEPFGGNKIGKVQKGTIYDSPYGGNKVGRIDASGFIYDRPYGGRKVGRVKNGYVYDKPYGGKKVGRVDKIGNAAYFLVRE